ncbi:MULTISPECIES: hypothetical protein [Streptosporangium]|uniref:Uncharacterized protein n=1 Tax=Streptosporangium brasiliense TaxID=47480 RepID=A0ABT9QXY4_9ACTN|nr:hypothetical protein [Streptosporangium brasiliense]MDP9861379.1 hypothetical protein [Streptosporangium brasiliense]
MRRLHDLLRERGDNFYRWMTPTCDIDASDHDPSLSSSEPEGATA